MLFRSDWERSWMDNFQPMRFGKRLWIVPSWHAAPEPEAVNLLLDPGLAFGTGTHPTTALCLEWLDGQDLTDSHVLDFGCGSGILAIAALLLGAKEAVGTDIDVQAIEASRDNAQRNGVAQRFLQRPGKLDEILEARADAGLAAHREQVFGRRIEVADHVLVVEHEHRRRQQIEPGERTRQGFRHFSSPGMRRATATWRALS